MRIAVAALALTLALTAPALAVSQVTGTISSAAGSVCTTPNPAEGSYTFFMSRTSPNAYTCYGSTDLVNWYVLPVFPVIPVGAPIPTTSIVSDGTYEMTGYAP